MTSKKLPRHLNSLLEDFSLEKRILHSTTKLHVAILVHKDKVIGSAFNKQASQTSGASAKGHTIHAEKNLLISLGGNYKLLQNSDIYVARITKTEEEGIHFMYSKPCPECTVLLKKCIDKYKLNKVYFTFSSQILPC